MRIRMLQFMMLHMLIYELNKCWKYGTVEGEGEGDDQRVGDRASYHRLLSLDCEILASLSVMSHVITFLL